MSQGGATMLNQPAAKFDVCWMLAGCFAVIDVLFAAGLGICSIVVAAILSQYKHAPTGQAEELLAALVVGGIVCLTLSIPYIIATIGIWRRHPWAAKTL